MIPSKSTTNNSRRSSILKLPKPRQPLQNLNFNSSSNENSPTATTKIKRRVSFAEKKHVKEFCNSLEQGTVWDNTYEENDLSNLKIPCSSNQKECEIESIFKENIFDNHGNDTQSVYNKVMEENINIKEASSRVVNIVKNVSCQDEMLMTEPLIILHDAVVQENKSISLTNLQLENNHISKSITTYEDSNRKLNEQMSKLSDHNDLNNKSVKDTCTDLTKVTCNNVCSDVNYTKDTPENISMELIQIILPSVNTQNTSMELTVPLLSVINDNMNDAKMTTCENERTKNLDNVSMEMTTAISMCNLQLNSNYCPSSNDNDNKTTFFNDVPKDITKTVCKCNIARQNEKTKLLNTSMEITSIVPANTHTKICTKDATDLNNSENSIKLSQCENNIAKQDEKTKLLNTSMEITAVVPANTHTKICTKDATDFNNPENSIKLSQCDNNIAKQDEKTKLLNTSMEITSVVPANTHTKICTKDATDLNNPENSIKLSQCDNNIAKQDEKTKLLNTSMEITSVVPAITHTKICTKDATDLNNPENSIKLSQCDNNIAKQDEKTKLLNTPMEITSVVPANTHTKICTKDATNLNNPENSIKLSQCDNNIAKQDEKTKLLNTSMEITSVVPAITHTKICTKDATDLNNSENSIKLSQCDNNIAKQDEKTKLLNTPMEITSVVPANTHTKICTKDATDLNNSENSIKLSQCDNNIAKQDEKTKLLNTPMEITSVVPANTHTKICTKDATDLNNPENSIKKLRINPVYETLANLSRTKMDYNESMEFTTAVTTLPKIGAPEHQNNLQTTIQNTPCIQSNSTSILDSCNSYVSSNETITFRNNSTFTNILSLDVRDNSGKARITDCDTNINENKAIVTTQSQTEINSDTDSIKIRQSVLSDNIQNRDLADFTICTDNVLKNITTSIAIPCALSSEIVSDEEKFTDKENNFSKNVENDVLDKSSLIKVQSSVNITSSSVQQDIFGSGLRKNNTEVACTTFNSISNDFFSAVNSELNKDKDKHTQTITSHPRRTYTIQSLDSNHTFTISNKENTNVSQINDNNFDTNNQETNVLNNEKYLQNNENYNEECPINKSDIIFNENIEILESIKTPLFYCLDDLSDINQSINVNCSQETNCFSKNRNDEHEDTSNLNDQTNVLDENVRKSCTFLIKCASSNSKLEQVQADEIQKLELLDVRDTNTKSQIIVCSSPIINDTEKLSQTLDVEENIQDLCLNNSNFENQNIQCLSNVRAICENTLKVNDDGKSVDNVNTMEINKESYANEELELSLKTHTCIEGHVAIELNLFSSLMNELKDYTKSDEIIWELYHENIEKNMFIAGFISCSLLVVIFIRDFCDVTNDEFIKEIKLISRLADDADILINIVHRIILEKLDVKKLLDLYKSREDILLMLDFISKEVKLAMDFMFELKCLNDLNLMEITRDRISFVSQTRTGNIILEITIDIKPFDKIESRNISVHCLMGSVREEDVKKLIMNIKRDHKFLRKYINDVKDYIYLMEESVI